MTLTVEDDFREFVAARWPDLEGVAFVVTLDAATARRVTTDALATLHQQWREALDEGRPGATARRSVLAAAVAAAPAKPRPAPTAAADPVDPMAGPGAGPSPNPWAEPADDDPVLTALEAVVRAATPLERALVGAGSVWGAGPDEVADLLGMPVGEVRERATALRGRLSAAHDAARVAEGLAPADWALDVDLDAVVEHLLAGQGDPPDPAALVEDRRRSVRRRSVVAGGAAAVAAGAVVVARVARGPAAASGACPSASARPSGPPAADDPSWGSVSRWAARGRLATDARVQGLVISRANGGGRLLWADDVDGPARRGLVRPSTRAPRTSSCRPGRALPEPTRPPCRRCRCRARSWPPARAPCRSRCRSPPAPCSSCWPGPPSPRRSTPRPCARPVDGTIGRRWTSMALTAGIGATRWDGDQGPAFRVRCAGFDGPVAGSTQTWVDQGGTDAFAGFAEETRRFVAAALGAPGRHRAHRGRHRRQGRRRRHRPHRDVRAGWRRPGARAAHDDGRRGRHPLGARRRRRPQPDQLARPRAAERAARRHPGRRAGRRCGWTTRAPRSGATSSSPRARPGCSCCRPRPTPTPSRR